MENYNLKYKEEIKIIKKCNKNYFGEKEKKYLNKCLEGIIKNITFKNSLRPKISILVPVYNSQRTIKSAIRSIQNQKMIDIEIILVNDKSNDKSLKIIKNFQKTDKRIKIAIYSQRLKK